LAVAVGGARRKKKIEEAKGNTGGEKIESWF
jgi:hypothetical protein